MNLYQEMWLVVGVISW